MPQMTESDQINFNSQINTMEAIDHAIRVYMNRPDFNISNNDYRTGLTNMLNQLNQGMSYYNQTADNWGFPHHPGMSQFAGGTQAMSAMGYTPSDVGSDPYSTQALGGTPLADTMQAGYNIPTGSNTPITPTQVQPGYGAGPGGVSAPTSAGTGPQPTGGEQGASPAQGGTQPPTTNLQPGMTGDAVKQLQDWLVSEGVMTQAQVDTGYGTYGPQTRAAVASWQQSHGVQGGQYAGYWGPQSIQAYQSSGGGTTSGADGASGGASDINATLSQYFTPDQISSMSPSMQSSLGAMADYFQKQFEAGTTVAAGDINAYNDALTAAQDDPEIAAKYGDALTMGTQSFTYALSSYQTLLDAEEIKQARQFKQAGEGLSESEMQAGRAYSGYREQAKERLLADEGGIIESTRSGIKDALQKSGTAFEGQFGSEALPGGGLSYVNPLTGMSESFGYAPSGGITGTDPLAKKADVRSRALQSFNLTQLQ